MNYEGINLRNATLIDVREPLELENDGKIANGINIPLGTIASKIDFIKTLKSPIVLYCRTGNRSGQALAYLENQGVENIYNGGSWQEVAHKLG
ncbi:MAG: sulfurtransferase [Bacteroidetes bacterium HGW-Bacteroidetes-12]|jgi:rhodanese-related sulfurtransferase|nr:MAG: sulfurtransferase [Bacteroidetes bacterium HGW-Bacteroidetes-12]